MLGCSPRAVTLVREEPGGVAGRRPYGKGRVKGIFPPLDEWWGLQIDLDWDAQTERYVTWDLSYKQDSHEGWIPLTSPFCSTMIGGAVSDVPTQRMSFDRTIGESCTGKAICNLPQR